MSLLKKSILLLSIVNAIHSININAIDFSWIPNMGIQSAIFSRFQPTHMDKVVLIGGGLAITAVTANYLYYAYNIRQIEKQKETSLLESWLIQGSVEQRANKRNLLNLLKKEKMEISKTQIRLEDNKQIVDENSILIKDKLEKNLSKSKIGSLATPPLRFANVTGDHITTKESVDAHIAAYYAIVQELDNDTYMNSNIKSINKDRTWRALIQSIRQGAYPRTINPEELETRIQTIHSHYQDNELASTQPIAYLKKQYENQELTKKLSNTIDNPFLVDDIINMIREGESLTPKSPHQAVVNLITNAKKCNSQLEKYIGDKDPGLFLQEIITEIRQNG